MQSKTNKTDRRARLLLGIVFLAIGATPWIALQAEAQGRTGSANTRPFTQGDELVQLDFKDVELPVVIETIARITGRNFIYDDRVRGRVTIVSPSEVTADQAYAVFESVLKIKGFTAVPGPGGVLKIVPIRDAKESSIETIRDNRPSPNRDSFVTRLVPLLYIDAEAITNTIKPLVSKDASMVAYAPTNTIIMTDTEANIRRILSILEAIDVETYREELAVIKVKHADAATLGQQVSEIYGAEVSSSAPTPASRSRSARNRRNAQAATNSANVSPGQKVRIITDERTNSLLVLASRGAIQDIRDLVRQLDVPLIGGGRIHVYYLKHADAEELAETLNGMLSGQTGGSRPGPGRTGATGATPQNLNTRVTALAEGITINHDAATNSLVIQASKEAYEALAAVIQKLDIARPQVLVEAMILEVDVTDGIDLGVEWTINAINGDQQFFFSTASAAASGGGAGQIAGVIKQAFDVGADGVTPTDRASASGTNFDAVLKAAATDANLNLVSAPHILTSDNEEAEIRIGDNIPIITSRVDSATGNTAGLASSVNVERQDIGVTLRVTPQISEGDSLRLKIFQELTAVNEALQQDVGSAGEVGVALSSRKVENTVVVKDSETVVVGGLINDQWDDKENKVPFLGDIPGLGWAFKSTSKRLRKINLIVFLTPHIIRSADEMELETIKRRRDFEGNSGARYNEDQQAEVNELDAGDYVWTSGKGPVRSRLRELDERYSMERKEELEEILRDREQQRITDRLDQGRTQAKSYALRVAIFTKESTAAEKLTKLIDAGYDGTVSSDNTDGGLLYELIVGPFDDLQTAEQTSKALREVYNYDPTLILMSPQSAPDEETAP